MRAGVHMISVECLPRQYRVKWVWLGLKSTLKKLHPSMRSQEMHWRSKIPSRSTLRDKSSVVLLIKLKRMWVWNYLMCSRIQSIDCLHIKQCICVQRRTIQTIDLPWTKEINKGEYQSRFTCSTVRLSAECKCLLIADTAEFRWCSSAIVLRDHSQASIYVIKSNIMPIG